MTDTVLDLLKLALLGLLYLFFARVLWAVWSEVRGPRTPHPSRSPGEGRATKGRRGRVGRLVIVEPRDRRGSAFRLDREVTIGRDETCTISLTGDSFVSALHARVFEVEGQPMVEDLGSTNGSYHNGNRLTGMKLLHPGDRIQIGRTVLEAQ